MSNRTALSQLALVEHYGWSVEKIAQTWNQPVEHVREILSELSLSPLQQLRQVPSLPATKEKARERRDVIRLMYLQGWSVEQLVRYFFYYGSEVMQQIVKQPLETEKGKVWGKAIKLGSVKPASPRLTAHAGQRVCACGCGRPLSGKRKWAREGCRKRGSEMVTV